MISQRRQAIAESLHPESETIREPGRLERLGRVDFLMSVDLLRRSIHLNIRQIIRTAPDRLNRVPRGAIRVEAKERIGLGGRERIVRKLRDARFGRLNRGLRFRLGGLGGLGGLFSVCFRFGTEQRASIAQGGQGTTGRGKPRGRIARNRRSRIRFQINPGREQGHRPGSGFGTLVVEDFRVLILKPSSSVWIGPSRETIHRFPEFLRVTPEPDE